MARMMDSLIMNDFPPYTFTKITTTHRPARTSNGATKLLTKSTTSIPSNVRITSPLNNNGNGANNLRQTNQKPKVPTQGLYTHASHALDHRIFFARTIFLGTILSHLIHRRNRSSHCECGRARFSRNVHPFLCQFSLAISWAFTSGQMLKSIGQIYFHGIHFGHEIRDSSCSNYFRNERVISSGSSISTDVTYFFVVV